MRSARPCRLAAACLPLLLAACATPLPTAPAGALAGSDRPPVRVGGERLPAWSGNDPASGGRRKVAGLVWLGPGEAPGAGGRYRTDHVVLGSDAPPEASLRVARLAEDHVRALVGGYGDALDLRLPQEPLPVVLHERREAFKAALREAAPDHPGWGAFYDAREGTVHVCLEAAPSGALPLQADVRHEMTHQILDLSTPARGRGAIFEGHYLWLWEGFAAWTESLGDPPGTDSGAARRARFDVRRARGEVTDLPTLFDLGQTGFEGRHYDESAVLVAFLMDDGVRDGRRAVLHTLRDLMRDRARRGDLERGIAMTAAALDAAWRETW